MTTHLTTDVLWDLRRGALDFAEFTRLCRSDFVALAIHVAKGWGFANLPPAVEVGDLVQEMLLAVHQQIGSYDPKRGGLKEFVVFRACCAARKELRRNFNSKDRDERATPDIDVQPPRQEEVTLAAQRRRMLAYDERQQAIIDSLARTGSLELTAAELLAHPDTRSMFAGADLKAAHHSVYRTARKLAQRAQATAS